MAVVREQQGCRRVGWLRHILVVGGGLALGTTALVVGAQMAGANTSVTLYVNTAGTVTTGCTAPGSGACQTIQDGISAAEAYSSSDVTVMVATGTYDENDTITVPSGDILTVEGAGSSTTEADGGHNGSVLTISSGVATIDGLTISDGSGSRSTGAGGGVYNAGTVTLTNDTISNNSVPEGGLCGGGGVFNYKGTATLTNDTLTNDNGSCSGGGVANFEGTATLTNDAFSNDTAGYGGAGGGVYNYQGTVTLTDDTISNDSASQAGGVYNDGTATLTDDTISNDSTSPYGAGGGIANYGTATLTNDTIWNDSAAAGGGVANGGTATLTNDTLSNDTAWYGSGYGGGVWDPGSTTTTDISNSILQNAPCTGSIGDGGYNVESDNTCGFGSSDLVNNSNINLATSLAANGSSGPETLAIGTNSSAYEEVPLVNCIVRTDERGDPRPGVQGQNCDAGAYELFQITTPSLTTTPNPTTVTLGPTTATLTDSAVLSGGSSPTGKITFTLYDGATLVDTEMATVSGNGTYSAPTGYTLPSIGTVVGIYQWDASYSGDPYNSSVTDDNDPSEQVTVSKATPTLSTSPTPTSVILPSSTPLKDAATLSGGYNPTGSITFTLYYNEGSSPVDTETSPVSGNGTYTTPTGYTLPTTGSVAGTYQWDASYSGDTNNASISAINESGEQVFVFLPLAITTPSPLPSGRPGAGYSTTLSGTGGEPPYSWSIVSGSLDGLTLFSSGTLSGAPTTSGVFTFTVKMTDSEHPTGQSISKTFTLSVANPLQILTPSVPSGDRGRPYSASLSAIGGVAPYHWSITTGTLPGSLALNPSSGVISGQLAGPGTYTFTVTVTDSSVPGLSASKSYTIYVT